LQKEEPLLLLLLLTITPIYMTSRISHTIV
jgi:hypothetical protein